MPPGAISTPDWLCLIPNWMLLPSAAHAYQTGISTSTLGGIIRSRAEQRELDEDAADKRELGGWRGWNRP